MKKIAESFEEKQGDPNVIVRKEIFDDNGAKFTRVTHYRRWYIENPSSDNQKLH